MQAYRVNRAHGEHNGVKAEWDWDVEEGVPEGAGHVLAQENE